MVDLLRRSMAPVTAEAWKEIDETAARVIKSQLSARTLVDVSGPHGWDLASVNLGRLEVPGQKGSPEVPWGIRQVQPLIETRIHFQLNQWELDNVSRGCDDPDVEALEDTAQKAALFEENAIYNGFKDGQIKGLIPSAAHKPIKLPANVEEYPQAISEAIKALALAGVGGPYALALGTKAYYSLVHHVKTGYPLIKAVRNLLGGEVLWSPALEGGVLLSTRGGDFELVLGQDFSIGYASHDKDNIELFLTESFTFRVLEPEAVIALK